MKKREINRFIDRIKEFENMERQRLERREEARVAKEMKAVNDLKDVDSSLILEDGVKRGTHAQVEMEFNRLKEEVRERASTAHTQSTGTSQHLSPHLTHLTPAYPRLPARTPQKRNLRNKIDPRKIRQSDPQNDPRNVPRACSQTA